MTPDVASAPDDKHCVSVTLTFHTDVSYRADQLLLDVMNTIICDAQFPPVEYAGAHAYVLTDDDDE